MWLLQGQADTFGSTQGSRLVSQSKDESFAPKWTKDRKKAAGPGSRGRRNNDGQEGWHRESGLPQASAGAFCEGFSLWSGSPDPDYTGPLV